MKTKFPVCSSVCNEFVPHFFPLDWQQCWRNRQTSQDHREKVKEDKIPQVHTHLGLHSSGFLKLNPEFAKFRQRPLPARRPLSSASGRDSHEPRTSTIWILLFHESLRRLILICWPDGMDDGWGMRPDTMYLSLNKTRVNSQQWFVGGPAAAVEGREYWWWPMIYLYSLSRGLNLHLLFKKRLKSHTQNLT